jgi:hypothetical protein
MRDRAPVARRETRRGNAEWKIAAEFIGKRVDRFLPKPRIGSVVICRADFAAQNFTVRRDYHALDLRPAKVDADRVHW